MFLVVSVEQPINKNRKIKILNILSIEIFFIMGAIEGKNKYFPRLVGNTDLRGQLR
jgi:hypothetical protein